MTKNNKTSGLISNLFEFNQGEKVSSDDRLFGRYHLYKT